VRTLSPTPSLLLRVWHVGLTRVTAQGLGKKLRGGGIEAGVLSVSGGGLLGSLAHAVSGLWRDRAAAGAEGRADLRQATAGGAGCRGLGMIDAGDEAEVFLGGSPPCGRR
jgi:hypothetical protein